MFSFFTFLDSRIISIASTFRNFLMSILETKQ